MEEQKKYDSTFAIMKGIAIISVVVGYCTLSKDIETYVNQYHLAAFFFVAGYFLTGKYVANPLLLIKKRIKSLYFPFIISCLTCVLLHNLLCKIYVYSTPLSYEDILIGVNNVVFKLFSSEPLMGAMWFCPTLLFASIITGVTLHIGNKFQMKKTLITIGLMGIMISIAEVALKIFHLKSPYTIWQNIIISGILFEGWLFRNYIETHLLQIRKDLLFLIGIVIAIILGLFIKNDYLFNLQAAHLKDIPAFYLLAVTFFASLMVYTFSFYLKSSYLGHLIAIVGNHSFSIMLLHFLSFKLVNLLICLINDIPLNKISKFPTIPYENIGWLFVYTIVGCILPISIVLIKNKLLNLCAR